MERWMDGWMDGCINNGGGVRRVVLKSERSHSQNSPRRGNFIFLSHWIFLNRSTKLAEKEGLFVVYNNNNNKNNKKHVYPNSFDNSHRGPQSTCHFYAHIYPSFRNLVYHWCPNPVYCFFVLRRHWHPLMTNQHCCPNHFVARDG